MASNVDYICMRAAMYLRVSTDKQKTDMQVSEVRRYVQAMGWNGVEYVEKESSVKHRPVFEQLMDQFLARIVGRILFNLLLFRPHEHNAALDFQQHRRQDKEIAGCLDVNDLQYVEVLSKLVRDQRNGNIADIYFITLDQMQEQIKRAVVFRQPYLVIIHDAGVLRLFADP